MITLSLSHYDLDGVGCQIVLRKQFGELTTMNTSYGRIDEYLDNVESFCHRTKPKRVFITDLSFNVELLTRVNRIAEANPDTNFYFIDHHPFEGEWKHLRRENLTIVISDKASATKLTFLYLKSNFKFQGQNIDKLEQFVHYVNAYDIWLEETPEFKMGFVLNELFWKYKLVGFWAKFKDEYSLSYSDKEVYKDLIKKKNKLFKKLDDSGRILRFDNRVLLIFVDDFQGHVTIDYPGFLSYIIVRSTGKGSVRLKTEAVNEGLTKDNLVNSILKTDYISEAGGHPGAFGFSIVEPTAQRMIEFSKILISLIDDEFTKINL